MGTNKTTANRAKGQGREPIRFLDEHGQEALKVPLDGHGKNYAIVSPSGFRRVREAGVTGAWVLNDNGNGHRYVRSHARIARGKSTLVQLARVIAGAGKGTAIRYFNGDRLDLREANLQWTKGKAKREDAQLVRRGAEYGGKAVADSRKAVECVERLPAPLMLNGTDGAVAASYESQEGLVHA